MAHSLPIGLPPRAEAYIEGINTYCAEKLATQYPECAAKLRLLLGNRRAVPANAMAVRAYILRLFAGPAVRAGLAQWRGRGLHWVGNQRPPQKSVAAPNAATAGENRMRQALAGFRVERRAA